jgi:hypothetical protein
MGAVVDGVDRFQCLLIEGREFGHSQHFGFGHVTLQSETGFGQRCPENSKKSKCEDF